MEVRVIKIGGSTLYDDNLNLNLKFLKKIVGWFEENLNKKIVFVVGGGKLSRFLLRQIKDEVNSQKTKHSIGIKVTQMNSLLVCSIFNDENVKCFNSLDSICNAIKNNNVRGAIIGGLVEGWSTDMVAANIAKSLRVSVVNKISDIDYIYSGDPKIKKNVKAIEELSWDEYIRLFNEQLGKKHEPGMNAPIDIECSLFCKTNNISFRVSGGDLTNKIEEILLTGTLVS